MTFLVEVITTMMLYACLQLMTSVTGDAQVDTHLQESYLNERCAYLTEQLARHKAQMIVRPRSASMSENEGHEQSKPNKSLISRQRRASAQVTAIFLSLQLFKTYFGFMKAK